MPSSGFAVPVVDIAPYVNGGSASERARVAEEIDRACSSVGFIQVLGHRVAASVIDGLAEAMDEFFALPLELKNGYQQPPGVNRGYSPPKSEMLSLSIGVEQTARMNDFFEAFNVGSSATEYPGLRLPADDYAENVWPGDVADFTSKVSAYYLQAKRVARTLTRIFADALGLAPDFFLGIADHPIEMLRMNNYALPEGHVDLDGDLIGMGEHTDFGIVTVLWADQVAGLQVLGSDRRWHDVSPVDGALLVNLGDLTARLTNDRWMSTLHRVKPPVVDGTVRRRRSAAFFHDGNVDATIAPLSSCVQPGTTPLYEPITVGANLAAKLSGSRGLQSNVAAIREASRVRAATAARDVDA
jgi:isopenicillin N synthase-like dioxygenase